MSKSENVYYYGLGSNWAFTKLESLEEAQRLEGFDYVVKHLDHGNHSGVLYPVNEKDEKTLFEVNRIRCLVLKRVFNTRYFQLRADIQDEKGVIQNCFVPVEYARDLNSNHFIELKKVMLDLSQFGTWEAKEAEEQRLKKEEEIKKMQEENERLKKENASLQQEINDLKAKLNH